MQTDTYECFPHIGGVITTLCSQNREITYATHLSCTQGHPLATQNHENKVIPTQTTKKKNCIYKWHVYVNGQLVHEAAKNVTFERCTLVPSWQISCPFFPGDMWGCARQRTLDDRSPLASPAT